MDDRKPIKPERFFSAAAKRWVISPFTQIGSLWFGQEDRLINMAAGLPNNDAMPFGAMNVTLKDGSSVSIDGAEMDTVNQYGSLSGLFETRMVFRDLLLHLHQPPTAAKPPDEGGLDVCVLSGNNESSFRIMELILDPGDFILIDEPAYPNHIKKANNLGLRILGVKTDGEGLIPDALRQKLSPWSPEDALKPDSNIPKLLLTVPNGSNPTGATTSLERRTEIYQICREYDIIILEDDPSYFILFDHEPLASYLSLDGDGRVIRLDSFSKVFSPGFRCGFMSGHAVLLERLISNRVSSYMQTSNLPQIIYQKVLQKMGIEGFLQYTKKVCALYKERRNAMVEAVKTHLEGLVEFNVPDGGMFLWLKIQGVRDTKDMVMSGVDKGVLFMPGSYFLPEPVDCPYVRLGFATPSPQEINEAIIRFAAVVKDVLHNSK